MDKIDNYDRVRKVPRAEAVYHRMPELNWKKELDKKKKRKEEEIADESYHIKHVDVKA